MSIYPLFYFGHPVQYGMWDLRFPDQDGIVPSAAEESHRPQEVPSIPGLNSPGVLTLVLFTAGSEGIYCPEPRILEP